MTLKPQDIVVILKLLTIGADQWTYASLATALEISTSQLYSAIKRVKLAQLASELDGHIIPNGRNLGEFLVHGLRYVLVPQRGEMTRGIATGYAAPVLRDYFVADADPVPVWPHPHGDVRGMSFSPIHKIAPDAALKDQKLYDLLALVDAIRGGRSREREIAINQIHKRLADYAQAI